MSVTVDEVLRINGEMVKLVEPFVRRENPKSIDERIREARIVVEDLRDIGGDKVVYVDSRGDWVRTDLPDGREMVGAYGFGIDRKLPSKGNAHRYGTRTGLVLENQPWNWWDVKYPDGGSVFKESHQSVLSFGRRAYGSTLGSVEMSGERISKFLVDDRFSEHAYTANRLYQLGRRRESLFEREPTLAKEVTVYLKSAASKA